MNVVEGMKGGLRDIVFCEFVLYPLSESLKGDREIIAKISRQSCRRLPLYFDIKGMISYLTCDVNSIDSDIKE